MHEGTWHAGVGNMPDLPQQGWLPWLKSQRKKGLQVQQHLQTASPHTQHAVLIYAAYSSSSLGCTATIDYCATAAAYAGFCSNTSAFDHELQQV